MKPAYCPVCGGRLVRQCSFLERISFSTAPRQYVCVMCGKQYCLAPPYCLTEVRKEEKAP